MSAIVKKTLADVWEAYRSLTIARNLRDPLNLDLPERRVQLARTGTSPPSPSASGWNP